MRYRRVRGAKGRVNAHEIRDWVGWLLEDGEGCCHKGVAYTENNEVCICVGWRDDGDKWCVYGKVGFQSNDNAMQTDLDSDFQMPWNTEAYCDKLNAQLTEDERRRGDRYVAGDVYDTSVYICAENDQVPSLRDCKRIADELNSCVTVATRMVCEMEATGDA